MSIQLYIVYNPLLFGGDWIMPHMFCKRKVLCTTRTASFLISANKSVSLLRLVRPPASWTRRRRASSHAAFSCCTFTDSETLVWFIYTFHWDSLKDHSACVMSKLNEGLGRFSNFGTEGGRPVVAATPCSAAVWSSVISPSCPSQGSLGASRIRTRPWNMIRELEPSWFGSEDCLSTATRDHQQVCRSFLKEVIGLTIYIIFWNMQIYNRITMVLLVRYLITVDLSHV